MNRLIVQGILCLIIYVYICWQFINADHSMKFALEDNKLNKLETANKSAKEARNFAFKGWIAVAIFIIVLVDTLLRAICYFFK